MTNTPADAWFTSAMYALLNPDANTSTKHFAFVVIATAEEVSDD